jgi:biopolymer transport protein TolQ
MSKLVLLSLLFLSIVCWTIFICKLILFHVKKNQINAVMQQVKKANNIEQLLAIATMHEGTVPGYFLSKTVIFSQSLRRIGGSQQATMLQNNIDQTVDSLLMHEESYLPVLQTSAAVSPLLGLFGTVWGLVHSFLSISEKQSADITTVAPGLAEALITTLAGLMVAIPALVMYNILNTQLRKMEHDLLKLADHVSVVIQNVLGV